MSIGLSQEDIEVMLRISRRYGVDDDSALLPWDLFYDLQELIACDSLTVALHGSPGQAVDTWQTTPAVEDDEPADEVFWAHFWDSLDCSYPDRSGDLVSVTLTSDFYSERAYRNTGMYVEYGSRVGVEHEIRVCLPAGPGRSLRLLWARGPGPNFTERDRAVLTLLRPHLQVRVCERRTAPPGNRSLDRPATRDSAVCRCGIDEPTDRQTAGALRGHCSEASREHLRSTERHQQDRGGARHS